VGSRVGLDYMEKWKFLTLPRLKLGELCCAASRCTDCIIPPLYPYKQPTLLTYSGFAILTKNDLITKIPRCCYRLYKVKFGVSMKARDESFVMKGSHRTFCCVLEAIVEYYGPLEL
jgi:hypothetical protein